jgi:hypothetical protein
MLPGDAVNAVTLQQTAEPTRLRGPVPGAANVHGVKHVKVNRAFAAGGEPKGVVFQEISSYIVYMVIEQTVEIPVNRRIFLDLPLALPAGKAKLELKVTPVSAQLDKLQSSETPLSDRLLGAFSGSDLSLEQLRAERLSKYS